MRGVLWRSGPGTRVELDDPAALQQGEREATWAGDPETYVRPVEQAGGRQRRGEPQRVRSRGVPTEWESPSITWGVPKRAPQNFSSATE